MFTHAHAVSFEEKDRPTFAVPLNAARSPLIVSCAIGRAILWKWPRARSVVEQFNGVPGRWMQDIRACGGLH
jgi:hypothetical protein